MSGPKCVDIHVEPRSAQRKRNRSQCKILGAEYVRLESQYRQVAAEMAEVGLDAPEVKTPGEIKQNIDRYLGEDHDTDAVNYLNREVGQLRASLAGCKSRLQTHLAELQKRFLELSSKRQFLEQTRSDLLVDIPRALPANWPDVEKSKLMDITKAVVERILPPSVLEPQFRLDAIASLEAAERIALVSEKAFVEGRALIERQINNAHGRILTDKLMEHSGPVQSLSDVLKSMTAARKPTNENDQMDKELDGLLAHIIVLKDTGGWNSLMQRVCEIRAETNLDRRQMLYDDLLIRCQRRLKQLRENADWKVEIDKVIDSMAHLAGMAPIDALVEELEAIKRSGRVAPLDPLRLRVKQTVEAEERRLERERKRRAVLQSIRELGYETTEGMETAFVHAGTLVVQKSDDDEYAVEFATNDDLSLLQTAMIRYSDSEDTSEQQRLCDTAREEAWCGDHSQLLEKLASHGFETKFRMKHKAGSIPMKVVIDQKRIEAKKRADDALLIRRQAASANKST